MLMRALVVERDTTLRQTLQEVVREAGYASIGVDDLPLARMTLRASPSPLIVLLGHGDPRVHLDALADAVNALPQHVYLILTTRPDLAPRIFNTRTDRTVPVLAVPCDLDTLLASISDAVQRLRSAGLEKLRAFAGSDDAGEETLSEETLSEVSLDGRGVASALPRDDMRLFRRRHQRSYCVESAARHARATVRLL